ncbi:uncharacterized protein LOC111045231 [Nilaparvata lugens]|uniref:uncharacterized protein LOC111045231 n=1 Tax=Nilaparvata lugens TaxID=108931 RepID=UPI000B98E366|nr:uncharacterized protein LOC111045231 [Nilaparvata lugens]XP_022186281.1 uncharacterized protein LOC111045231 [Nilaparvata lugens]
MRVMMRPLPLVLMLLVLAAYCLAAGSDDMKTLATLDLDSRFPAQVIASSLPLHQLNSPSSAVKAQSESTQPVDMTVEPTLQDSTDFHLLQDALDENNNLLPSLSSGEVYRALGRARSLAAPKPEPATENNREREIERESSVNLTSARTSSPDIQDIITGFVKLLNPNAQTSQANRPLRTRINNRGPPRITDLVLPPPTKPPYPFQKPPLLSPLPAQSRPQAPPIPIHQPQPFPLPRPSTQSPISITTDSHDIVQQNNQHTLLTNTNSNISSSSNSFSNKNVANINYGTVKNESFSDIIIIGNNSSLHTNNNNDFNNFISKHSNNNSENSHHHVNYFSALPAPTIASYNTSIITVQSSIDSSQLKIAASKTTSHKIQPTSVLNKTVQSSSSSVFAAIEPSIQEVSTELNDKPSRWHSTLLQSEGKYAPRPGIVLDDTEYKPGVAEVSQRTPLLGDIFDVTVSAVQGGEASQTAQTGRPYVYPVEVDGVNVITTAEPGQHFVSIDGKRTYINLLGRPTSSTPNMGTVSETTAEKHRVKPVGRPYYQRPTSPPVRIDTCIVGDDSTCDASQHEYCKTEFGVSSCHCRPGYSRRRHRESCHRVLSLVLSIKPSKLYEHQLVWSNKLLDRESHEFIQIEYEASRAIDSALSMTPYSDELLGSKVNNIYKGSDSSSVYVNLTIQLEDTSFVAKRRSEETLRQDMHYQLVGAINRRGNNVGNSGLWVDNPQAAVSPLYDLDECSSPDLHDCHMHAVCRNTFGSFQCTCGKGLRDTMAADDSRSGRHCESCPAELCGHRGYCEYNSNSGQPVCKCLGNFYGAQCQIDGEVLGVAVGASLLAVIIIASTLACLCIWSRKWSREDDNMTQYGTHPYTLRGPKMPQYGVCLDERLRWAQMTDTVNHYAPEPVCRGPPLPPPPALYGRGPPPQLSSSEDDDLHLLSGAPFHVPRPKSTSNESAIYWTAEYAHHTGPRMVTAQF